MDTNPMMAGINQQMVDTTPISVVANTIIMVSLDRIVLATNHNIVCTKKQYDVVTPHE